EVEVQADASGVNFGVNTGVSDVFEVHVKVLTLNRQVVHDHGFDTGSGSPAPIIFLVDAVIEFTERHTGGQVRQEAAHVSTDASANGTEVVDADIAVLDVGELVAAFSTDNHSAQGHVVAELSATEPAFDIEYSSGIIEFASAAANVGPSVENLPDGRVVSDGNDVRGSRHDRVSGESSRSDGHRRSSEQSSLKYVHFYYLTARGLVVVILPHSRLIPSPFALGAPLNRHKNAIK